MPNPPAAVPDEAEVVVTYENRIGWQVPAQKKGARPEIPQDEDFPVQRQPIAGRETLMAIADFGKAYPLAVATLPGLGTPEPPSIVSLLPKSAQKEGAKPVFCGFLPSSSDFELILLSEQGRIKRLARSEFTELSNRGLTAVKLKDGDRLQQVSLAKVGQQVAIATTGGRVLRFALSDSQLPVMGRNAQGTQALRLRTEEQIVGLACHNPEDELVLVSQLGYGKRLTARELRLASRGDIGTQAV
ncbi:MAG: hypothetical protein HC890_19440 [Chloroflexaceae bacterium]|nr:hypothetical protein [Chloroflexaceae bacterium]